ncbi:MAG: flagellar motor switch protein FliN [Bdellovibrionota bacterium]|nr:MAG: flagellar motor switch protein FliN [Bdellovibrionota bacterium]
MAENEEPQAQADEAANVASELEKVASAAEKVSTTAQSALVQNSRTLDVILDVLLQVTVEVGRARMTIQDLLQLGQGSVIELEKLAGEPLDVYINGKLVAKGEAVILNEKFGVRILDVISKEDRVQSLST